MFLRQRPAKSGFSFSRRGTVSAKTTVLDKLAKIFLLLAAFLGIFAVSPWAADVHQFPKFSTFTLFAILGAFFWLLGRVRTKDFSFYEFPGWQALAAVVGIALLSALFSGNPGLAILGNPAGVGLSFVGLAALYLFIFSGRQYLQNPNGLRRLRAGLAWCVAIAFLFFAIRTFVPLPVFFGRLGLSIFSRLPLEMAAVAAAMAVLSLAVLSTNVFTPLKTALWSGLGVLALVLVVLIGSPAAWAGLLLGSLLTLAATVSRGRWRGVWSAVGALLVLASLPFAFFGTPRALRLALPIENTLNVNESWSITKNVLYRDAKQFLLGTGFGGYPVAFAAYRPAELNFSSAFGATLLAPAGVFYLMLVEGGVLMFIPLLIFIALTLVSVFRVWNRRPAEGLRSRIKAALGRGGESQFQFGDVWPFIVAFLALRAATFFSVPSFSITVLMIVLLTLYFAGSAGFLGVAEPSASYAAKLLAKPRVRLAKTITAAVLLVLFLFFWGQQTIAEAYFGQAIRAYAQRDLTAAEQLARTAQSLNGGDARFALGLAQVLAERASAELKNAAQTAAAVAALSQAAAFKGQGADYWIALAAAARGPSATNEQAKKIMNESAERAEAAVPGNPALRLAVGDLYAASGDYANAIVRYQAAILLKADYLAAYFRAADVALKAGDTNRAQGFALTAVQINPANADALTLFVNVSLTRRAPGDETAAAAALESLAVVQPSNTAALAILGQLYEKLGQLTEARRVFERLNQLAPETQGLGQKLQELNAAIAAAASSTPAEAPKEKTGTKN